MPRFDPGIFRKDTDPEFSERIEYLLLILTALSWLERRLALTFYRVGIWTLRWGMAVVFIWFGAIKLQYPPAVITAFANALVFTPDAFQAIFPALIGLWEMIIGICFLRQEWMRWGILQMKAHIPGTFLPFLLTPDAAFQVIPLVPALPGLYILKNIIFVGAAFILWVDLLLREADDGEHPIEKRLTDL